MLRPTVPVRLAIALLTTLAALGCAGGNLDPPPGDADYADTGLLSGGGFNDTGVAGFAGQSIPNGWSYLFGDFVFDAEVCYATQECGIAGVTDQFAGFTAKSDSLGFISTSNFFDDLSGDSIVVRRSGLATDAFDIPGSTTLQAARLTFDYAFLTSRNEPAIHNDSAVVRLIDGSDTIRVLRIATADLQPGGAVAPAPGGCGRHVLGDTIFTPPTAVTTDYTLCSGWLTDTFDVSEHRGSTVTLEIVVDEVGGDTDRATTFLIEDLRLEGAR